jgi:CHAT domain-containing protein
LVDDWSLLRSALFLAPGDGEDGRVSVDELVGLHVNANLVVLAACRSGAGAVLSGEGLQGLTAPFLESGAASVVATLWQIGDRSAAPLVELFYRELTSGASVGDALHRAKLAARAQGISPGVWSAFTLTGDDRVRTSLRPPATDLRASILTLLVVSCVAGYFVSRTMSRRNSDRR